MKRGNYVTPYTRRICVCTEGTFASSATVENPDTEVGRIEHQEINTDFNTNVTFGDEGWE